MPNALCQIMLLYAALLLPIRSIDFYYSAFQAASVRIFRDKSKMCFLELTWSNLCRKLLNLLAKYISSIPISPIISKGGAPCRWRAPMRQFWFTSWHRDVLDLKIL